MFNIKTALELIGANSLIYEPPISAIWETFQIGVNITEVDCPAKNESCFIERINERELNKENFIIAARHVYSVSLNEYFGKLIALFTLFVCKIDMYEIGE